MTTPDLKKLAEVKRWNAGDLYINDEVVKIEDHLSTITTLLQEVDTLREDAECWRYYKDLLAQYNTSITQLLTQSARHEEAAPQDVETKP